MTANNWDAEVSPPKHAADWEAQSGIDATMRRDIKFLKGRVEALEGQVQADHLRLVQLIARLCRTGIIVDQKVLKWNPDRPCSSPGEHGIHQDSGGYFTIVEGTRISATNCPRCGGSLADGGVEQIVVGRADRTEGVTDAHGGLR